LNILVITKEIGIAVMKLQGDPRELKKSMHLLHRAGSIPGPIIRWEKFTDVHFDNPWSKSNEIFEKIQPKSFEILCKKSILLSCLVILSVGLKIGINSSACV
jgi:hypothetical protein